jgi:hypothetical protein
MELFKPVEEGRRQRPGAGMAVRGGGGAVAAVREWQINGGSADGPPIKLGF